LSQRGIRTFRRTISSRGPSSSTSSRLGTGQHYGPAKASSRCFWALNSLVACDTVKDTIKASCKLGRGFS
jgi:hypothetical protein